MSTNEQVNVNTGEIVSLPIVDAAMTVAQLEQRLAVYDAVRNAAVARLKDGTDFGQPYPGAPKPCLLKAGAEKLNVFFGFAREIVITERVEGEGYFEARATCRITRNGQLVATGTGSCNSREYRYDKQINPTKYDVTDQRRPQTVFDLKNTIEKMAAKRCFVDAILGATGLSDIYTQDLDDNPEMAREKAAASNLKAMQTKYDGKCAGCGGDIKAGDEVMYQHGNKEKGIKAKVYHPGCVGKTPPEANGTAEKKPDIDEGAPATDKQIGVIDKLISKRDEDAKAWWATVQKEYREALTQGRAGKIIQQLGALAPDALIPEAEWNDMLAGVQS